MNKSVIEIIEDFKTCVHTPKLEFAIVLLQYLHDHDYVWGFRPTINSHNGMGIRKKTTRAIIQLGILKKYIIKTLTFTKI